MRTKLRTVLLFLLVPAGMAHAQAGCYPTTTGYVYNKGFPIPNCIGVQNVTVPTGSGDACAQIVAAISSLSNGTGTVDARGIVGSQTCSSTLAISKPITLLLGQVQLILGGCPGISITSSGPVVVIGQGWQYSYTPTETSGTVLTSSPPSPPPPCPLIQDFYSSGSQWRNLELNGNSQAGAVGILTGVTGGGGYLLEDIHVHHFLYAGMVLPGTGTIKGANLINNNGGDGMLLGTSPTVVPGTQVAMNGGNGIHTVGDGPFLNSVNVDLSCLNDLYCDGRVPSHTSWSMGTTYVSQLLIQPPSNPNGDYFYELVTNCTTGSSAPNWASASPGTFLSDGTSGVGVPCEWLDIGTGIPGVGTCGNAIINNPGLLRAGASGNGACTAINNYPSDLLRMEGDSSGNRTCGFGNTITGGLLTMFPGTNNYTANGLHLLNCTAGWTITGTNHIGRSYPMNPSNPSDGYGFLIENSDDGVISNTFSLYATKGAYYLTGPISPGTSNISLSNIGAQCWAPTNPTGNNLYAFQMDSGTRNNFLNDVMFNGYGLCGRNELGILDMGLSNTISKYHPVLASYSTLFDTFDSSTDIQFDASYPWTSGNLPPASIVSNGSQLWCSNCPSGCSTGAGSSGQQCVKINGTWVH